MNQSMMPRRVGVFDNDPFAARSARSFVHDELARLGAPPQVIADLTLVVSELIANAVQHGGGGDVEVVVAAEPDCWSLEVSSESAAIGDIAPPDQWELPTPDELTGRGLGIVRTLTDDAEVRRVGNRVSVVARRRR